MSFNRPDYLEAVLVSLTQQTGCDIAGRKIVLFQDGGFNEFSKTAYAQDSDIAQCQSVFRRLFPEGLVMASPVNLGVALNFDRAEIYGFETLGAESVIFLEDDLVLQPHYIALVDSLVDTFKADERVGYVGAYGDHSATLEQQTQNKNRLISLSHNWGFALYRRHWLRIRPRVRQYLDIVKTDDYNKRDRAQIHNLFKSWGFGCPADSQDAAKTIATVAERAVKINTYTCNAHYIGQRGLHMNSTLFTARGYDKTAVFTERVDEYAALDDALYQSLLRDQKGWASSQIPSRPETPGAKSPPAPAKEALDPADAVNASIRDIIFAAYRSVLKRDPDADGLAAYTRMFRSRAHSEAFRQMLASLLGSSEFRRKQEAGKADAAPVVAVKPNA